MATEASEVNLSCFFGILFTIPHDFFYFRHTKLPQANSKEQLSRASTLNQSNKGSDNEEDSFNINKYVLTNEDNEPSSSVSFTSFLYANWKETITNDLNQKASQYKSQFSINYH